MLSTVPGTNSAVAAAQRLLDAIKQEEGLAAAIQANDPRTYDIPQFSRQNIVRTQLVSQAWKHIGRQVLAIHPEIVNEVKVATSEKVPGEVLRVLPYMNPLVVYSDPPEFKTWLGGDTYLDRHGDTNQVEDRMRLLGFMGFGTREVHQSTLGKDIVTDDPGFSMSHPDTRIKVAQQILTTNDPDANRFGILLMFEALDSLGNVVDIEFSTITIFYDKTQTLGEMVEEMMKRFQWNESDARETKKAKKWMREVLSTVVGTLFYLCSTTLEAEKVPAKATGRLHHGISRKPLSLYRIGWTTGAALTRYRQSRTNSTSEQQDISHQRDPEHRRSHFKLQPYGPGRTQRKLIFISAYWTHKERLGEMGVNTVRKVPRAGAKGDARQSQADAMKVGM